MQPSFCFPGVPGLAASGAAGYRRCRIPCPCQGVSMSAHAYVPPRVSKWEQPSGGTFASINRPVAGPTHDKTLPVGKHPLQLYSMGTPNGVKVTVMLEELLALGHTVAGYEAGRTATADGAQ